MQLTKTTLIYFAFGLSIGLYGCDDDKAPSSLDSVSSSTDDDATHEESDNSSEEVESGSDEAADTEHETSGTETGNGSESQGESESTADSENDSESDSASDSDSEADSGDDPSGENGSVWGGGDCQDDIVATGIGKGDVLHDLIAPDQHGNMFRLYSQCHRGVLLEASAEWCTPCKEVAKHTEEYYQAYKKKGYIPVIMLQDALSGVDTWANRFELNHPILEVYREELTQYFDPLLGYPDAKLIKPGMVVHVANVHPMAVEGDLIEPILP